MISGPVNSATLPTATERHAVRLSQALSFLAEGQTTWISFFPQMTKRAQQEIAAFLCVRRRQGCQFGELSGYIKQNFLLDEATIKDRIRDAIAASLVTMEPELLSSRSFVIPTAELLERYDRFLAAMATLLGRLAGESKRPLLPPGALLDPGQREALTEATHCHVECFEHAVNQICADRGMSRARSLEVRRSLQSISHWTLIRMVMEIALLPNPAGPPDILADDLAASMLGLTRQNFQTTRDHINYLISAGVFERRGGKTLHVGLTNTASLHFRDALTQTAERLAKTAGALAAGLPADDRTVELSKDRLKTMQLSGAAQQIRHSLNITGPAAHVWRVALENAATVIGRSAPSDVILPGQSVSRTHCRIDIAAGSAIVTDLDSTNGTRVRGARIMAPTALQPGDLIAAGDYTLVYEAELDSGTNRSNTRPGANKT